jgi:hypothetical protein
MFSEVSVALNEVAVDRGSCLVYRLVVAVVNYGAGHAAENGRISAKKKQRDAFPSRSIRSGVHIGFRSAAFAEVSGST